MKAAILQSEGKSITFSSAWNGEESSITITDGESEIPLDKYCKKLGNVGDVYRNQVLIMTQMYDNRVKAYFKHIFLSEAILHYAYRIEFQVRGMFWK